jgi:outer membrane protein assembly factor BamB
MTRHFRTLNHIVLLLPLLAAAVARGQTAEEVLSRSGLTAGLVVHLGTTDGELESALARVPRMLVQGLALSGPERDAARKLLAERGQYGLATVRWIGSARKLPHATNLVNLLIVDADGLGAAAPEQAELLRVVCPGGRLLARRQGAWQAEQKEQPADTDEWTHYDYDARGNAVSRDERVAPPQQVQWISGIQPMVLGDNPAAFSGSSGLRLAAGRVFSEWTTGGDRRKPSRYGGWLAYNGLPLWSIESEYHLRPASQTVAVGNRLYMFPSPGETLIARDADTGRLVRRYDSVGAPPKENPSLAFLRVAADKVFGISRNRLTVADAETGEVAWTFQDGDRLLLFPSVDVESGRVYLLSSDQPSTHKIEHRWPNARAAAIVCLDLRTGRPIWRNTELAGRQVGQIVPHGPYVGLFAAGGIGAGKQPCYANLRASDGKMLWTGTFPTDWNRAGYMMLWRDDAMYYADPWKVFRLDPETGTETVAFGRAYNGRCMRFTATKNYFLHSFVAYVDRDFRGEIQSVARSACANSAYPGNGMLYFTPNTCRCFSMLRGHIALTPEAPPQPVDDAKRFEAGAGQRHPLVPPAPRAAEASLLWEHATRYGDAPPDRLADVQAGGRILSVVPHEHRLECRDSEGKALWQYTADARLTGAPLVLGEIVYLAAHDGYLHAVNLGDGSLAWRFHAAPSERWIMVHGQLESAWPLYGATLHQGKICVAAGYHPEIGGGIHLWGLEPESGRVAWQRVLSKRPAVMEKTQYTRPMVPHSCTNGPLQSTGEMLTLPGSRDERLAFDPRLANEELRTQLESPPQKVRK